MQFAERCNLKLTKVDNPFPEFAVPAGDTLDSYFEQVCRAGLARSGSRLPSRTCASAACCARPIADYEARLEREIDCIKQMKFPGYFMIVWDFIRYAQGARHPRRPGPRIGRRIAGRLRAWRSPTSIRCRTSCSSSAS